MTENPTTKRMSSPFAQELWNSYRGYGTDKDGAPMIEGQAEQNPITDIIALIDAMDQLLDDMGPDSCSVCLYAKAKARIAMEPFITKDYASETYMPLREARAIVEEHDG